MKRRRSLLFAALACALSAGAWGCGGSDDDSAAGESTSTTTATTTAAGNERLTAAEWATYQTTLTEAQTVNEAAVKTFAKCRDLLGTDADTSKVKTCLGTSTTTVVDKGQQALAVLEGFNVTGACASAQTDFVNNVRGYVSSVNGMTRSLEADSTASLGSSIDNAQEALTSTRETRPKFEAACKPL